MIHRQGSNWPVDFLFASEVEASAADKAFAELSKGEFDECS
jgi:hypothetical protein